MFIFMLIYYIDLLHDVYILSNIIHEHSPHETNHNIRVLKRTPKHHAPQNKHKINTKINIKIDIKIN